MEHGIKNMRKTPAYFHVSDLACVEELKACKIREGGHTHGEQSISWTNYKTHQVSSTTRTLELYEKNAHSNVYKYSMCVHKQIWIGVNGNTADLRLVSLKSVQSDIGYTTKWEVQCVAAIQLELFQWGQFEIVCIPDDANLKLFMSYPLLKITLKSNT